MRPVFSRNFIKSGTQTTGNVDYTVPAGFVASVKSLTAYKATASPACDVFFLIFAPGDPTGSGIWIARMTSTTFVEAQVWNGTVVLEAGWTLRVQRTTAGGSWSATASGYLLTAP